MSSSFHVGFAKQGRSVFGEKVFNSPSSHVENAALYMMDWVILVRLILNLVSVTLHIFVLLLILCRPKLHSQSFDELFFSQNLGDIIAVLLRVVTKYAPVVILRNHSGIVAIDRDTFPLATITNASEWYTNYVIIISSLVFGFDRAVMAVSMDSYNWFCNRIFKWVLVLLTWILPFAWVLPMFDLCCGSRFIDGRVELLEMKEDVADSAYDSIDMIFETLFYVPLLCILNGFTLVLLYHQWMTLLAKLERREILKINGRIPTVSEIVVLCGDKPVKYIETAVVVEKDDVIDAKLCERLELELSFSIISVIDQQIDFLAVLFYSLYWAGYMEFITLEYTTFLHIYYVFFEVGNLISPYILLAFCKKLRREFCDVLFHRCCVCSIDE